MKSDGTMGTINGMPGKSHLLLPAPILGVLNLDSQDTPLPEAQHDPPQSPYISQDAEVTSNGRWYQLTCPIGNV